MDMKGTIMADERELKNVLAQIEKDIGKGAIMRLGETLSQEVSGISTGALSLDIALGGKGLPRGRVVEIYGAESSGKTTVALHAVANAQKAGGVAAFIDAEHALDPGWAKRLGVDLESLLVSQPSCAEEALKVAEMLIKSNAVDIIVIDSVAALVPRAEIEGEIGDSHVGVQARLMSQALRILTPAISKTKTCMVFINQVRLKIGVMYGNPETTSGGLALKFYSSVRLEVRKGSAIKDGEDTIGTECKVKVVKNKVAPPFRTALFELMHDRGISRESDLLNLAVDDKIVEKRGSWHYYGEMALGQSGPKAKEYLRENPALMDELTQRVLEKRGLAVAAPTTNNETPEPEPAPAPAPTKSRRAAAAATEA
jgi:recombination protein RecA